jgi:CheY-like chemotaxis protein
MKNQKIFLAEDDQTMLSLLKTLLEMEGYKSSTYNFTQKESFIEQIRVCSPDLVLMDVHLKGQNGIDYLRQIKMDNDLQYIKVIMSSGSIVKDECISAGADGFLMKPFMPDDLIQLIEQVLA